MSSQCANSALKACIAVSIFSLFWRKISVHMISLDFAIRAIPAKLLPPSKKILRLSSSFKVAFTRLNEIACGKCEMKPTWWSCEAASIKIIRMPAWLKISVALFRCFWLVLSSSHSTTTAPFNSSLKAAFGPLYSVPAIG